MATPTVSFSELSKNSKRVADSVERAQRLQVTRRDGEDLFLTTARHDRDREETATVTVRLLAALLRVGRRNDALVRSVLHEVFPWVRHLSDEEARAFADDLLDATQDAVELDVHANLHRTVVEWRATARILADPQLTAELTAHHPDDDFGEVLAP